MIYNKKWVLSATLLIITSSTYANAEQQESAGVLEEIVVIAQKREQNLQTTALSVDVLSSDTLDRKSIMDLESLQFATPSLTAASQGITSAVNIRGIGLGVSDSDVVAGVAVYRDGLFQPAILSTEPLYDMDTVEVLRGPQGTLIGSISTGGAIFYNSANPELDATGGDLSVLFGNYGRLKVTGAVNMPFSDELAMRVAFNFDDRDSFFTLDTPETTTDLNASGHAFLDPGNRSQQNLRIGLLWQPNESLSVLAKTTINKNDTDGLAHIPGVANPFYDGRPYDFELLYNVPNTKFDESSIRQLLQIDYEFSNGMIARSITGYGETDVDYIEDRDSSNAPGADSVFTNVVNGSIFSQEFNLISASSDVFEWTAGAFYYRNPVDVNVNISSPNPPTIQVFNHAIKQTLAGFAHFKYNFSDSLQAEVGIRYTDSESSKDGNVTLLRLRPTPIVIPQFGDQSDDDVTGKLGLNWFINDQHFAYAYVSKGYKPGGVNGTNTPNFDPESVIDYEFGLKSTILDGHLKMQLNAFYMDYTDMQIDTFIPPEGGYGGTDGIDNVGESTIKGIEAQVQAVFGSFLIDFGLSYVDSKLGETLYIDNTGLPGGGSIPLGPQCPVGTPSNPPLCFDYVPYSTNLSGQSNPFSPKLTYTLGVQYDINHGNNVMTSLRLDYMHMDEQYMTILQSPADYLEERDLLNAQIIIRKDDWRVKLFATNLTDELYVNGFTHNTSLFLGRPRQYGIEIGKSF